MFYEYLAPNILTSFIQKMCLEVSTIKVMATGNLARKVMDNDNVRRF